MGMFRCSPPSAFFLLVFAMALLCRSVLQNSRLQPIAPGADRTTDHSLLDRRARLRQRWPKWPGSRRSARSPTAGLHWGLEGLPGAPAGGTRCPRKLRQRGRCPSLRAGSCSPGARSSRSGALVPRGMPAAGWPCCAGQGMPGGVVFTVLAAGSRIAVGHVGAALALLPPQLPLRGKEGSFVPVSSVFLQPSRCPKSCAAAPRERTRGGAPPGVRIAVLYVRYCACAEVLLSSTLPSAGNGNAMRCSPSSFSFCHPSFFLGDPLCCNLSFISFLFSFLSPITCCLTCPPLSVSLPLSCFLALLFIVSPLCPTLSPCFLSCSASLPFSLALVCCLSQHPAPCCSLFHSILLSGCQSLTCLLLCPSSCLSLSLWPATHHYSFLPFFFLCSTL